MGGETTEWVRLVTVGRRARALEDELGHPDGVAEGVVHAGQLQAEALQHGGDHGVELPGEVVRRAEAPEPVHVPVVLGDLPLERAAAHQRRAQHAESPRPGGVQLLRRFALVLYFTLNLERDPQIISPSL